MLNAEASHNRNVTVRRVAARKPSIIAHDCTAKETTNAEIIFTSEILVPNGQARKSKHLVPACPMLAFCFNLLYNPSIQNTQQTEVFPLA